MTRTWIFNYTGKMETFIPPVTGIYTFEVQGAQGGNSSSGGTGGFGALVSGDFKLESGKSIYVFVGGQGKSVESGSIAGGFGGGGDIGSTSGSAASGGGASDIRVGGFDLSSRVIVAAGGGGGGWEKTKGGYGGVRYGESGQTWSSIYHGGSGAGPTYGGRASATSGVNGWKTYPTDGKVGAGGTGVGSSGGGGGGGGGYYGGGGSVISGGGGGSSYNTGLNQSGKDNYRTGNGLVTITLKSEPSLLLIQDGDIIKTYQNGNWQTI